MNVQTGDAAGPSSSKKPKEKGPNQKTADGDSEDEVGPQVNALYSRCMIGFQVHRKPQMTISATSKNQAATPHATMRHERSMILTLKASQPQADILERHQAFSKMLCMTAHLNTEDASFLPAEGQACCVHKLTMLGIEACLLRVQGRAGQGMAAWGAYAHQKGPACQR